MATSRALAANFGGVRRTSEGDFWKFIDSRSTSWLKPARRPSRICPGFYTDVSLEPLSGAAFAASSFSGPIHALYDEA